MWTAGVDALVVYDDAAVHSAVHSAAGADDVVAVVVELEDDFDLDSVVVAAAAVVAELDDFDFEAVAAAADDDAFHTVGHRDVHNVAAALLPVPDCFGLGRHDVAVDVLGSDGLNEAVDAVAADVELDIVDVVVHLDTVDACHDLVAEIQELLFHTAAAAADSHFH